MTNVSATAPAGIGHVWDIDGSPATGKRGSETPACPARPMWFGDDGHPAFGWFHYPPDTRARGGVVICHPLGQEYIDTHFALRALAERLAGAGFCAMRFDYDGTGDSAGGSDDPERVESWLQTVELAVRAVRETGVSQVSLLGMRLGAALAATTAARTAGTDQLVLWDPCSGERFLREQQALMRLYLGSGRGSAQAVDEVVGLRLGPGVAADIAALGVPQTTSPLARRVLLVSRSDRADELSLGKHMAAEDFERVEAIGQADLMDKYPPHQKIPMEAIGNIVTWLLAGTTDPTPITPPEPARTRCVGRAPSGARILETPVRVGPVGLFGVLTTPADDAAERHLGVPALFVNTAKQHHVGPTRLWVELARLRAGTGGVSLRLDLSGLGDSPNRPGEEGWMCHRPSAFDDIAEAALWLSPGDPAKIVLVGLCSSGYQVLESALDMGAQGVIAVNPPVSLTPAERALGTPLDPRRRIAMPKDQVADIFREGGRLAYLRVRFPRLAWRARILLQAPRRRPGKWLRALVRQGTDTLLICGDREFQRVRSGTTDSQLRRLRGTGLLQFEHWPRLQHDLFLPDQRQAVKEAIAGHLASRFSA